MNSGFEDCLSFVELVDDAARASSAQAGTELDLGPVVTTFGQRRRPQAQALARLSLANYTEMRAHTASWTFRVQKRIEAVRSHDR